MPKRRQTYPARCISRRFGNWDLLSQQLLGGYMQHEEPVAGRLTGRERKISMNEPRKYPPPISPSPSDFMSLLQCILNRSAASVQPSEPAYLNTCPRSPRGVGGCSTSLRAEIVSLEKRASGERRAAAQKWPFSQIAYLCCVSYMVDSSHSIGLMDSNWI